MQHIPSEKATAMSDSKPADDECTLASSSSDYGSILKRIEANASVNRERLQKFVGVRPSRNQSKVQGTKVSRSTSSSSSPQGSSRAPKLPPQEDEKLTKQCSFPSSVSCIACVVGVPTKDSDDSEGITKSGEKKVTFLSDIVAKSGEIEAVLDSDETKDSTHWRKAIKARINATPKKTKKEQVKKDKEIEEEIVGSFKKIKEKLDHDRSSLVQVSFVVPKSSSTESMAHSEEEEQEEEEVPFTGTSKKEETNEYIQHMALPHVKIVTEHVVPERRTEKEPSLTEKTENDDQSSNDASISRVSTQLPLSNIVVDMQRTKSTRSELTHRSFDELHEEPMNWIDFVDLWLNDSDESWTTEMDTYTFDIDG